MANIDALRTGQKVSPEQAETMFREINDRRFSGLFTITRDSKYIEVSIGEAPKMAGKEWNAWCCFEYYWQDEHSIETKWPVGPFDWHTWLWIVFRAEYLAGVAGWVHDGDSDDYCPYPTKFPTYWDWYSKHPVRAKESEDEVRARYNSILTARPEHIRQILEGGT